MKPAIVLLLFIFGAADLYSQQVDTISGFGRIRMHMSESDFIAAFGSVFGNPIVLKSNNELKKAKDLALYKVQFKIVGDLYYYKPSCKEACLYFMKTYTSSFMDYKNIYLFFFKGKLIDITLDYSPYLDKELSLRYGRKDDNVLFSNTMCKGKDTLYIPGLPDNGFLYDIKESIFYRDDSIKALSILRRSYDIDCKLKYERIIRMYDKGLYAEVLSCMR